MFGEGVTDPLGLAQSLTTAVGGTLLHVYTDALVGFAAVANMSLGGSKSAALDQAVKSLSDAGVFVAVAAGNDNADACQSSPAGAAGVLTL